MPKEWKNRTKRMGKGILRTAEIMFVERIKPALRLAIKVALAKPDNANNRARVMKMVAKIAFPLMKAKAGDQKSRLARKIPAIARLMRPLKVKKEFINSCGFSALGRKRMSEKLKPSRLNVATRLAADIMAEL